MAWLRAADTEVKRDMEISRDEVRVMTVHGAKGLEASVVFLVDTTSSPSDTQRLRLIHLPVATAARSWSGPAGRPTIRPSSAKARNAMLGETEDEYRRLLYVAMTRAADRLIVGGCMPGNMNSVRKHSWYDLIVKGLANSGLHEETIETRGRPDETLHADRGRSARQQAPPPLPASDAPIELPSWLQTPAPPEAAADGLLRPSDPGRRRRPPRPHRRIPRAARARACSAARWCTGCCNPCPIVATERRRDAALSYLARNADGWTDGEREALAEAGAGPDRGSALRGGIRAPAAAPRSRSSAGWSGRDGRRRWFPGRSTGWW